MDALGNFIKHQHRSVPEFLVDNLELRRIAQHCLDPIKGLEDLRDTCRHGVIECVFLIEPSACETLFHVRRSEEGEQRVHRVLLKGVSLHTPQLAMKQVRAYPREVPREVAE